MTQNDNGPGPGRKYGETAVLIYDRKVFFGQKKQPKFLKILLFILEKGTFSGRGRNMVRTKNASHFKTI